MKRLVLMSMGYLLMFGVSSPLRAGMIYNAAADFSLASNPNGAWNYGYSTTLGGTFILYTHSTTTTFGNPNFSSWQGDLAGDGTPLVVKNLAATTQQGGGANLLPGELALHPGIGRQDSIVRWTAPDTGTLFLTTTFEGRDNGAGTTTDVHVLDNNRSLFSANVNGFGPSSDQSFSTSLSVTKGDVIDFAVGVGPDGNFVSDTTGLSASINFSPAAAGVPEPSSILLFGMGGASFAVYGWRRRKMSLPARAFVGHGVAQTLAKHSQEKP